MRTAPFLERHAWRVSINILLYLHALLAGSLKAVLRLTFSILIITSPDWAFHAAYPSKMSLDSQSWSSSDWQQNNMIQTQSYPESYWTIYKFDFSCSILIMFLFARNSKSFRRSVMPFSSCHNDSLHMMFIHSAGMEHMNQFKNHGNRAQIYKRAWVADLLWAQKKSWDIKLARAANPTTCKPPATVCLKIRYTEWNSQFWNKITITSIQIKRSFAWAQTSKKGTHSSNSNGYGRHCCL